MYFVDIVMTKYIDLVEGLTGGQYLYAFTLDIPLPDGIHFNPQTGEISGAATVAAAGAMYVNQ